MVRLVESRHRRRGPLCRTAVVVVPEFPEEPDNKVAADDIFEGLEPMANGAFFARSANDLQSIFGE